MYLCESTTITKRFYFLISGSFSGRYRLALSSVHLHQKKKEEKGQIQKSWIHISTVVPAGKDCAAHPGCAAAEFHVDEMLPWRSMLSSPLQTQRQHTAVQVLGNTEKCAASVI